jgi:hypothetical protein
MKRKEIINTNENLYINVLLAIQLGNPSEISVVNGLENAHTNLNFNAGESSIHRLSSDLRPTYLFTTDSKVAFSFSFKQ